MRELREASGLYLRQVGAHFDIDKAAVQQWETGRSAPSRDKLAKLDDLYQAQGEVLRLYDVLPAVPPGDDLEALVSSLRADLEAERTERRFRVNELRDALEETVDNLRRLTAIVAEMRDAQRSNAEAPSAEDPDRAR